MRCFNFFWHFSILGLNFYKIFSFQTNLFIYVVRDDIIPTRQVLVQFIYPLLCLCKFVIKLSLFICIRGINSGYLSITFRFFLGEFGRFFLDGTIFFTSGYWFTLYRCWWCGRNSRRGSGRRYEIRRWTWRGDFGCITFFSFFTRVPFFSFGARCVVIRRGWGRGGC